MELAQNTAPALQLDLTTETVPKFQRLTFPLEGKAVGVTSDPFHFRGIDIDTQVLIPIGAHPGAFGFVRTHHVHEGVDLYCNDGQPIVAMETGVVVAILDFTGPSAGSPWWHDTRAVMIEGKHGVINYGELEPDSRLSVGATIALGDPIGRIRTVLRKDKGRPRAMLHLELYEHGVREPRGWPVGAPKPAHLLDPTGLLVKAAGLA